MGSLPVSVLVQVQVMLLLALACLCLSTVHSSPSVCSVRCGVGEDETVHQRRQRTETDRFCWLFCNSTTVARSRETLPANYGREDLSDVPPMSRIINGKEAQRGQFPFAASLRIKYVSKLYVDLDRQFIHFCGGVIISTQAVLTAAHCVQQIRGRELYVAIGEHDINSLDPGEQNIRVRRIIKRPQFNPATFNNDIAVLHLMNPFEPSPTKQAVDLGRGVEILEKVEREQGSLTVLGWGVLEENGVHAERLNYVNVPHVNRDVCRVKMWPYLVNNGMFCAGNLEEGGVDACQGDSGGPIVYRRSPGVTSISPTTSVNTPEEDLAVNTTLSANGAEAEGDWVLTGLVSWGIGCAKPDLPGIYTNVLNYQDWVRNNMLIQQ